MKLNIFQRAVTAVSLAILTTVMIAFFSTKVFAFGVGFLLTIAAWEWCRLENRGTVVWRDVFFSCAIGIAVPVVSTFFMVLEWILGVSLLWWMYLSAKMILSWTGKRAMRWHARRWNGLLLIFPAGIAVVGLHSLFPEGRWYLLVGLIVIWTTDTSAYLAGRIYGNRLLAPNISPKKNIEGVLGGFAGAVLSGLLMYQLLPTVLTISLFEWILLIAVTAIFSVIGDLTESAYKRGAGVKDSGRILPGHGGVLDRLDSSFAAMPVFVMGLLYAVA